MTIRFLFVLFIRRFRLFLILVGLGLVQIDLKRTYPRLQLVRLLENVPLLQTRQAHVAHALAMQQLVNELIHMNELVFSVLVHSFHLAVVDIQRLEILVHIRCCAGQTHVERAQCSHVFKVLVADELDDDVFLWLDLKHLED